MSSYHGHNPAGKIPKSYIEERSKRMDALTVREAWAKESLSVEIITLFRALAPT